MEWLLDLGYLGLFLGTFLAGTVLPLSSDVLLIGMLAAKADPAVCLVVAAVGNWLGAMTSYWMVRPVGVARALVRGAAGDAGEAEGARRSFRCVARAVFLGSGDRCGLHDRAGNLPRAAPHDGVHGACRLVRPVSFLGVAASGVRLTGEEGRPGIAAGI